ncbi:GNAT family N-acetyltransferase [Lysinibacillus piscis]|uniref:Acetyltransferase n=1 Tax=Lysinibacillus piscis TaxID=2518931 RepID=A0ABQ5NNH6_9BACI|nr:GNAT family N-acetyltransferase [Lysinibacillus sp. KH24]GLC89795.1 acetyltransferase [Lysinibacillus sp. KH24]
MVTFQQIYRFSTVVAETEDYQHHHQEEMRSRYDSNFIEWLKIPTLQRLKEIEMYQKSYHLERGQEHLKWIFPADEELPVALKEYLQEQGYLMTWRELYAIDPMLFQGNIQGNAKIQFVDTQTFPHYAALQYEGDLCYGEEFAQQKQWLLQQNQQNPSIHQVIAVLANRIVGSLDLIEAATTIEIDNFFVLEEYQRKGIGSAMQRFVANQFANKTIILIAEGEDTAKDMYRKQGYVYHGKRYEATKMPANIKE